MTTIPFDAEAVRTLANILADTGLTEIEIEHKDGRIRVLGSFTIKQTDFGIKPYSKAFGTIGVADELTIYGDVILNKPKAAAGRSQVGK